MMAATDYPTAGPLRRLAALGYDSLLVVAISMVYTALVLAAKVLLTGFQTEQGQQLAVGGTWFQCGWVATIVFFFCYFWHRGGQTLGMRAWRLRLITRHPAGGADPAWSQCLLRCLLGPFSLFCAGLGYLWCYIDQNGHSLHDRLTGTQVIVVPKTAK